MNSYYRIILPKIPNTLRITVGLVSTLMIDLWVALLPPLDDLPKERLLASLCFDTFVFNSFFSAISIFLMSNSYAHSYPILFRDGEDFNGELLRVKRQSYFCVTFLYFWISKTRLSNSAQIPFHIHQKNGDSLF